MLAVVLAVVLIPFIWLVLASFKPLEELFGSPDAWLPSRWTLEHFARVLQIPEFRQAFQNSVVMTVAVLVSTLTIAIPAAYGFARFRFRGRLPILYSLLLFQFFPTAVFLVPYYILFSRLSLINTLPSIIIVQIVYSLPFSIWLLVSYFQAISPEFDDAAAIDGCGSMQTLWYIILPIARPALAATAVYICIRTWQEFLLALTFSTTIDSRVLPVQLALYLSEFQTDWGGLLAGSVLANLPLMLLFAFVSRQFTSGLAAGGVKE